MIRIVETKKEESLQPLLEMAKANLKGDGLPFDIYAYSNNHDPPHLHIVKNNKSVGKFLLTKDAPAIYTQVIPHNCDISADDRKAICKWANKQRKTMPALSNWGASIVMWETIHGKPLT